MDSHVGCTGPGATGVLAAAAAATISGVAFGPDCATARRGSKVNRNRVKNVTSFVLDNRMNFSPAGRTGFIGLEAAQERWAQAHPFYWCGKARREGPRRCKAVS